MKKITLLFSLVISFTGFSQTILREYTFPDAASVTATQIRSTTPNELINVIPIADGSSPDASFSYNAAGNPTGALQIRGVNTATGAGRNFGYRINDDKIDYQGSSKLTVSFDIKRVGTIVESAVNLQLQIPKKTGGVITINQFNLENRPGFGETYLSISFDINEADFDSAVKLLIIDFSIGASPNIGSGGTILIDNLVIKGTAVAPTCSDGIKNGAETGIDCGGTCIPCITDPTVSAPIPTMPESEVLSVYSDTYTTNKVANFVFQDFTGNGPNTEVDIQSNGNKTAKLNNLNYYGPKFDAIDLSVEDSPGVPKYNYVHLDYYATTTNKIEFFVIDPGTVCCGNPNEPRYTINNTGGNEVLVKGVWKSVFIPLSVFKNYPIEGINWNGNPITQLKFEGNGTMYYDNVYFSKTNTLGTSKFETSSVKMYPNPVKNTLTIEANGSINKVSVYNIVGQEVLKSSPKSNSVTLQTNELQKGVYMVTTEIDGNISTSKVIKE